MKITKIPFDGFGIYLTVTVNLFLLTILITFRNFDSNELVYYLFQVVAVLLIIAQMVTVWFKKLLSTGRDF